MSGRLPEFLEKVIDRYPEIWKSYQGLGKSVASIDGLDKRTQELVKLGIAIGAGLEGAVHSHVRRALEEGCTDKEIIHTALQAVTTTGWPSAVRALSWVDDVLGEIKEAG